MILLTVVIALLPVSSVYNFVGRLQFSCRPSELYFIERYLGGNGEVSLIDGAESRGQEVGLCLFMLNS